jgi:hypothetical protein
MSKQIAIMQSETDIAEMWAAMPNKLEVGAIPLWMKQMPSTCDRPENAIGDWLLLFSTRDWNELRPFVEPNEDGNFFLYPRVGVVEWTKTEVRNVADYVVRSRIYFRGAAVPWSAGSARIYNWMSRWMKQNYFQAPALRAPIAIGPHLLSEVKAGRARVVYPSGKSVL